MLRLKVAALALVVAVVACGEPPVELRTAADAPAVVPSDVPRHQPAPTTTTAPPTTSTSLAPPSTTTTRPPATTSTTAPDPPPVAVAVDDCLGWGDDFAAVWPADEVPTACRIMRCETAGTGSPTIHNQSSSASGLFQFLDSTWRSTTGLAPPAAAHPAGVQIRAAHQLWSSSGWGPWSCY